MMLLFATSDFYHAIIVSFFLFITPFGRLGQKLCALWTQNLQCTDCTCPEGTEIITVVMKIFFSKSHVESGSRDC